MRGLSLLGVLYLVLLVSCKPSPPGEGNEVEGAAASTQNAFEIKLMEADKKVEVYLNGKLFTSYIYPDNIAKPVLYPLITASGKTLTRGFPLDPKPGERIDHPHHVGLWLNYGDVNGLDFWNNSEAIPVEKRNGYGTIRHQEILSAAAAGKEADLKVKANWLAPDSQVLLVEATDFHFSERGNTRIIDRTTTLTAQNKEVKFTDNKEGMIGIRVTRALEIPSDEPALFTDAQGNPTEVKALDNTGVMGNYLSSEALEGNDVWGTRGRWTKLYSRIDDEPVALAIIDHPSNAGYPTYWHARGYGLFAANPLGQKIFSKGKEELNFTLAAGQSVTFKYRVLVHSGDELSKETLNQLADEFAEQ